VIPARGFPQVEPVFVSVSKPLPVPPAALAKPIGVAESKEHARPARPVAMAPVMPVQNQIVEPPPTVAEAPSVIDALKEYQILLDSPSPEMLFGKLDSEKMLEKRMRQQAMQRNPPDNVHFPVNPPLTKEKYQARNFAHSAIYEEPNYVVYNRLYFEDKNAERYGWDLGAIQPFVSTLRFYKDVALWPAAFLLNPCQTVDTSAGQCLPGDPVPYLIYPAEIGLFSCFGK
jgi:hypothetical protein